MPLPAPVLSSVPRLRKAGAPPSLKTLESSRKVKVAPGSLVRTAPVLRCRLPPASVVESIGSNRRALNVTVPAIASGPLNKLVPLPDSVPLVQLYRPLPSRLPGPLIVPPECTKLDTVTETSLVNVVVAALTCPVPAPLQVAALSV